MGAGVRRAAVLGVCVAVAAGPTRASAQTDEAIFSDDFSAGLTQWRAPLTAGHRIVEDADGNAVLELETMTGQVHVLIEGSEAWGDVRIEGRVRFPDDDHNYLGFIYRYVDDGRRTDFGSLYIKGNGSYIQANPHFDTNVGRTLYPEGRSNLVGAREIVIGEWKTFALEVVGSEAHLYVGDMTTPAFTLQGEHAQRGAFGFKPRNPGYPVHVDDISVRRLDRFSYEGGPVPARSFERDRFVTEWSVLGPLTRNLPDAAEGSFDAAMRVEDDGRVVGWQPWSADHRGAVITSAITEYRGSRRVAYFHASIDSEEEVDAQLYLSSVDDLALWVNGTYMGFLARGTRAWWDSATNEERDAGRGRVTLREGRNDIMIRVAGGTYATGGFYLALEPEEGN